MAIKSPLFTQVHWIIIRLTIKVLLILNSADYNVSEVVIFKSIDNTTSDSNT